DEIGFDLYTSSDGARFTRITRDGLGDEFNVGLRNMVSTPYGLFVGSQNQYFGLELWREVRARPPLATLGTAQPPAPSGPYSLYLPIVSAAGGTPDPPGRLAVESSPRGALLSWDQPVGAVQTQIYRSDSTFNRNLQIPDADAQAWIPAGYYLLTATDQS